jgi:hypothetical protein
MDRLPSSFIRLTTLCITAGTSVIGIGISATGKDVFGVSLACTRAIFRSSSDSTEDDMDIESSSSPLPWVRVLETFSKPQCSSRRLRRLRTSKRSLFSEISGLR